MQDVLVPWCLSDLLPNSPASFLFGKNKLSLSNYLKALFFFYAPKRFLSFDLPVGFVCTCTRGALVKC